MNSMKLYLAPMEGITTYTYRNVHSRHFGDCDGYYAPFIVPTDNEKLSIKTLRGILPENNAVKPYVQVMCSTHTAFFEFANKIKALGYDEVNLNLGCPSGTVVKKRRGSGALKDPDSLDKLLYNIFENADIKITLKSRAGFYSHGEMDRLIDIYKKYPFKRLILHPRVREEFYEGVPNHESFLKAYKEFKMRLCYNGNIYSFEDYKEITNKFPGLDSIMIGRGCVKNPAIFREIKGGKKLETGELLSFFKELEACYMKLFDSEKNVLHKLKEIWVHAGENFPDNQKEIKAIKKATRLRELNSAAESLPPL